MEIHDLFKYDEIRGYIFGKSPNYESEFKLEKYIERILKFSAVFVISYFKKHSIKVNEVTMFLNKVIRRGYLTNDSVISVLSFLQKNYELAKAINLSELKILDINDSNENINIYEFKEIINDTDGAFIKLDICQTALKKLISQLTFITELNIKVNNQDVYFIYNNEEYYAEDLLIYEKRFFKIKTLKEIIPEVLEYERI